MLCAEELTRRALLSPNCAEGLCACTQLGRTSCSCRAVMGASRARLVLKHAEWLADHGHARGAEVRFQEASREAAEHGQAALAHRASARLGHLLSRRGRFAEALEALLETQRFGDLALEEERDPATPWLLGVAWLQAARCGAAKWLESKKKRKSGSLVWARSRRTGSTRSARGSRRTSASGGPRSCPRGAA
ncbi:unnamed protein product [Prorocentrum cordatum]|uniref:Uncharacterized protein n=1 Tax=Prorocentrum cordatum TaxID=2364126 RepID=A0ABN9QVT7_9DINO|nr:unnamed protein product [Polarella glacialis]